MSLKIVLKLKQEVLEFVLYNKKKFETRSKKTYNNIKYFGKC